MYQQSSYLFHPSGPVYGSGVVVVGGTVVVVDFSSVVVVDASMVVEVVGSSVVEVVVTLNAQTNGNCLLQSESNQIGPFASRPFFPTLAQL
jgi:hypothetical protein